MITKFKSIKNLAVFQNFEWDKTVKEKNRSVKEFKDINIFYGRNYSGKTTLSRILRALELNKISDKYVNPEFTVSIKGESDVSNGNLNGHSKKIRVFNEDFVRENLKFIVDPDASIEPFAILGDDNNKIEEEIKTLESELGINEEGKQTGLYKDLIQAEKNYETAKKNHDSADKKLNEQLRSKATTGGKTSIKYNSAKYGKQNYDIRELNKDIKTVLKDDYKALSNNEQKELEKLLDENTLKPIPASSKIDLKLSSFIEEAKELVKRPVSESGKIEELVKNAMLNKWVKEGRVHHKNKRDKCGFCGNVISENRWELLEKHFDEESERLEKSIDELIERIKTIKQFIKEAFKPSKNLFYSNFHTEIDSLIDSFSESSKTYTVSLDSILTQLKKRKNDLIHPFDLDTPTNNSKKILSVWDDYEDIRTKSNEFSDSLSDKKKEAQNNLRLQEISDFLLTIKYTDQKDEIGRLAKKETAAKTNKESIAKNIEKKEEAIGSKKRELNDEEKGAKKVNEFLNDFFGHGSLSLRAIEDKFDEQKQIRFQVIRDDNEAHHLSEGECSLLAFCYFMAKLEDTDTKGSKPIIWIDDPISSLDGNHIFFVFSLLKSEIVDRNIFEQLFISTHNLDFLKYLKRLTGGMKPPNSKFQDYQRAFFLINRDEKISQILAMPKYLKDYITEFNFLFEQVYKCAKIETVDDTNYTVFYNFGNNARKFLEIYLYYKYPDASKDIEKLKKFFGADPVPTILTDRINNEYSHLSGVFERGATPVEVPEMKKSANMIIEKLKTDEDQYNSLLKSIGLEFENEVVND
ncbi:AAA family ATPase [Psychroflexus aestuariivivens]|uniref:AAA family ATPase n=1 Tax=Psychroflexus aestuariivivens TaxID=1795040 RepID=UPI000FDAD46F|nr:AAA family ATPase [Psychroflexus aestuariivivens]